MMVTGKYDQKRNGYVYTTSHLVNDLGEVKMSYINGKDGHRCIAAGKDYISKIDLKEFFRTTEGIQFEYDVYD